jgi:hypothetical protein
MLQKHLPTIIVAAAAFAGSLIGSALRKNKKDSE